MPHVEFREAPFRLVKPRALVRQRADLQADVAKTVRERLAELGDLPGYVRLQLREPSLVVLPAVRIHHKPVNECDQQRDHLHRLQQNDEAELPDDPRTRTGWQGLAHGEMLHWTEPALALATPVAEGDDIDVWNEPYLETCCRSALHRLTLCGAAGRPAGLKDGPCLARLTAMNCARQRRDGRYEITEAGLFLHESVVMKRPTPAV